MEISTIFGTDTTTLQNTASRKDDKQDSTGFQEIMKECTENTDTQSTEKAEEAARASNDVAPAGTGKVIDTAKSVKIDTPAKETSGKTDAVAENQLTLSGAIPAVAQVLNNDVKTETDAAKGDGKADEIPPSEASIPEAVVQAVAQMLTPASAPAPANEASATKMDSAEPVFTEAPAINTAPATVSDKAFTSENKTEASAKTSPDEPVAAAATDAKESSLPEAKETIVNTGNDFTTQPENQPANKDSNIFENQNVNAGNIEIPKELKADTKETSDSEIKVKDAVKTEEPKTEKTTGFKESAKEFQISADGQIKDGDDTAKAQEALAAIGGTDSAPDTDSGDALESDEGANTFDNGMGAKADAAVSASTDKFSLDPSKPAKEEASVHKTEVYGKLENGIKASIAKSGKEVSLSLNPDHLGQMRIKLNIEDNLVSAKIVVDSAAVKGVLEADAGKLREVFGAQGLTLDKYTIELNSQTSSSPSDLAGGQTGMSREGAYNQNAQNAWRNFIRNTSGDQNGNLQYPQEFRESGIKKSGVDLFA